MTAERKNLRQLRNARVLEIRGCFSATEPRDHTSLKLIPVSTAPLLWVRSSLGLWPPAHDFSHKQGWPLQRHVVWTWKAKITGVDRGVAKRSPKLHWKHLLTHMQPQPPTPEPARFHSSCITHIHTGTESINIHLNACIYAVTHIYKLLQHLFV